jgi:hypothetical protein
MQCHDMSKNVPKLMQNYTIINEWSAGGTVFGIIPAKPIIH